MSDHTTTTTLQENNRGPHSGGGGSGSKSTSFSHRVVFQSAVAAKGKRGRKKGSTAAALRQRRSAAERGSDNDDEDIEEGDDRGNTRAGFGSTRSMASIDAAAAAAVSSSRFASMGRSSRRGYEDDLGLDEDEDEGGDVDDGGGLATSGGGSKTSQMHGISETMHVRVVFRARQTLLAILGGLGFDVQPHGNFTPAQIQVMKANDQLDMLIHHRSTPEGQRRLRENTMMLQEERVGGVGGENAPGGGGTQLESEEERKEYARNRAKYAPYEGRKVYVKYAMTNRGKSIRSSYLKELVEELYEVEMVLSPQDILVVVMGGNANDTLMRCMVDLYANQGVFCVALNEYRLQENLLEHSFVPPHRVLSEEEAREVMARYNVVDKSAFPEISRFDAVASWICMRPGQICEIRRSSITALETLYYRVCV